ncbi:MAG: AbrB/MazE/SpoVT family DNA-binding domain-containing protein [Clostridia bacterium]|nr:AbrB/MazE/SpoVT family DNA-binding domain-containing protein [Clostridia bacterium]
MQTLGIIRKADNVGRLVLPKTFRDKLGLDKDTNLEITSDGECIFIRKAAEGCIFCGKTERTYLFDNKRICEGCLSKLQK